MTLDAGSTFHLRNRKPDGHAAGHLHVRQPRAGQTVTYLAERGAVLDNPLGVFLVMNNGTIQQPQASRRDASRSSSSPPTPSTCRPSRAQTAVPAFRPQERRHDLSDQSRPGRPTLPAVSRKIPRRAALPPDRAALRPSLRDAPARLPRPGRDRPGSGARRHSTMVLGTAALFGVSSVRAERPLRDQHDRVGRHVRRAARRRSPFGIFLVLAGLQPRPPEGVVIDHRRRLSRGSPACSARAAAAAADLSGDQSMIGRTLALYFARRFAVMVLAIFMFFMLLITAITYLEFVTRSLQGRRVRRDQGAPPLASSGCRASARTCCRSRSSSARSRPSSSPTGGWRWWLPAPPASRRGSSCCRPASSGSSFGVIATTLYNPASTVAARPGRTRSAPRCSPRRRTDDSKSERPIWLRQAAERARIDHRRAAVRSTMGWVSPG